MTNGLIIYYINVCFISYRRTTALTVRCTLCTLNTVTIHLFSIYALFVSFIFASKHLAPKNNSSNFGSNCNNTYHGISIENVKYKTNISYHVFRLIFQKSIHQSLSTRYFSHLPPQNKKQVSSC